MSRLRRLMMMQGGTGESPGFIEFRKDKYVSTGILENSELKVILKIKFHSVTSYVVIMGHYAGDRFNMGLFVNNVEDYYNGHQVKIPWSELLTGEAIVITKDRNMTYFDGLLKAEHPYKQFSRTDILIIGDGCNADIYGFSIWQDGAMVDEYIPYVENGKEYFRGKNTGKLLEVMTKG